MTDKLPGAVGVWRARWLLLRRVPTQVFLVLATLVAGTAIFRWFFGLVAVGVVAVVAAWMWARRHGVRITESNQPSLHALVLETAARIGSPPRVRLWLTGSVTVAAQATIGRRDLLIGLPLVRCLSALELRALVGHELALLRQPRATIVVPLLGWWRDVANDLWQRRVQGDRLPPRSERLREELAVFATQVEHDADTAAEAAGGSDAAARAVGLVGHLDDEFSMYLYESGLPWLRRWWRAGRAISDLDDGWRRLVARNLVGGSWHEDWKEFWDDDERALYTQLHPGLAAALNRVAGLRLRPAADEITVAPMSRRAERRLVREMCHLEPQQIVRWTTFAAAPARWWVRRAADDVASARKYAETEFGRPLADDVDLASLMVAGEAEIPPIVVHMVEHRLLRRGWRLEHPAVRGLLVSPEGERVDLDAIAAGVVPAEFAGSPLAAWLTSDSRVNSPIIHGTK